MTEELKAPATRFDLGNSDDVYVSMENLFLHTLAELESNIGFLITDRYASHVLRVLLLTLSGEPLVSSSNKQLLQSKKKETISVAGLDASITESLTKTRTVPKSFADALERMIAKSVAGLDTDTLRSLAAHPNGSPALQLLLKVELTKFGKQRAKDERSIIRTLLPDDPITAESSSASFINGLLYDAVGSHLVEIIIEHAPGKMFKSLLREFFRDRLASLARNEVAGYIVCRLLERMGKDDLYDAHELLIPTIRNLLEKNRTVVVRTLIERCAIREIDTQAIAVQIEDAYRANDGFDVVEFIHLGQGAPTNGHATDDSAYSSTESAAPDCLSRPSEPIKVHFNLLAQAMLLEPGSLSSMTLHALVGLDPPTLLKITKDPIASRTLQAALTNKTSGIIEKRKIIQQFYGHIGDMAVDKASSHVVDCIWEGTHGLAFIRERIAEELAENEAVLRESQHGRAVWKNWKMDMYKRKRGEWVRQSKVKASNDGFQSFEEIDANKEEGKQVVKKTPLELARGRHAARKEGRGRVGKGSAGRSAISASGAPTASASS